MNPLIYGRQTIGLAQFGCVNRPFYHICVFPDKSLGRRSIQGKGPASILEQVGGPLCALPISELSNPI